MGKGRLRAGMLPPLQLVAALLASAVGIMPARSLITLRSSLAPRHILAALGQAAPPRNSLPADQCGAPQADGGGPVHPSPSAFVAPRARARPLFCLMINRITYFRRPIDIPALGPLPQRCISMGRRIGIYIIIKILMAPLRAWRPPRCPLACCAALRGRVAPAFILRPYRAEAAPSPPLPPSSRLSVLAPLLLRRMGRDRPDCSACPLPLPEGAFISFRSAKIPIPTPSPATLPPPAPGGGFKCILDYCAVSSPFPAPAPAPAPVRTACRCAPRVCVRSACAAPSRSRRGH